jgi:digeranylgeranylglycerophospholipid reductase
MHDVVVIGAGPSGLNAARRLAEGGLDTVVLERKSEIGSSVICTGIVGKEAFRDFDLSEDSVLRDIEEVKIISPYSTHITYRHPKAFANVVDRKRFDRNLADVAQSKGVEIKLDSHVLDISVNNNGVEVLSKIQSKYLQKTSAKMAIIATGIDYKLNKKLGLGYPKDYLYGIQSEIETDIFDSTHILVGNSITSGAFAWVVPLNGKKVRAGLVTEANPKICFHNLINRLNLKKEQNLNKNHIQFRAIAQGLVSKTYGERILSVGEAAGQVKTTSGGGIYYGLLCAELASEVILKSFRQGSFSAKVFAEYEKLWRKALQREILVGYYARKLCGKLTDPQMEKIFQIARSDGIIPLIKDKGNFDWHSELVLALIKRIPLFNRIKCKASALNSKN